jgi:hypothetical protein
MSVSSTTLQEVYSGPLDALAECPFAHKFFASSDLIVSKYVIATGVEEVLTEGEEADYTVEGEDDGEGGTTFENGGTVIINDALTSAYRLIIRRELSLTQEIDFVPNSNFPESDNEDGLDRLTMIAQQLDDALDRCLKVDKTKTSIDTTLPVPVAGMAIGWNDDEDGLVNLDVGDGGGSSIPVPIPDSYLEQIATAKQVLGSALYSLSSTPADAGRLPNANSPAINTLTEKTSIVANDLFVIEDSVDTYAKKKFKRSNMGVTDAELVVSNVTTNDVTTAQHGFVPKAPNDTTKFLRGDASWNTASIPSYDSGWFSAVANHQYSLTHGLGTTALLINVYYSSNGTTDMNQLYDYRGDGTGNLYGTKVNSITTTTFVVQTGADGVAVLIGATGAGETHQTGYLRIIAVKAV